MASRRIKYFKVKFPRMYKAFTLKMKTLLKVLKEPSGKASHIHGLKDRRFQEALLPKDDLHRPCQQPISFYEN